MIATPHRGDTLEGRYLLLLELRALATALRADGELDRALRSAAKVTLPDDPREVAAERASSYRGAELRASEEAHDHERQARLARLRAALVDGPTLTLPMAGAEYGFDPDGVVPLPGLGVVYEPLNVTAPWGDLRATTGVLAASDFSRLVVSAPNEVKGATLAGAGWTLTLKPGWKTAPGARRGDLQLIHP